jgi:hypothetical protein
MCTKDEFSERWNTKRYTHEEIRNHYKMLHDDQQKYFDRQSRKWAEENAKHNVDKKHDHMNKKNQNIERKRDDDFDYGHNNYRISKSHNNHDSGGGHSGNNHDID